MEVFPDIHNKMSKKIAQLTKVIYHLNTKNEDHQTELENLTANHQLEIQQLLRDATSRFSKFKESLDQKQAQVNVEAQMEKLQKKYAAEKESAAKDFQVYKVKVAEREQRITFDFQKKYDGLNEEVEKMNAKFQERMRSFEASTQELKRYLDDARSSGSSGMQELRKKYEFEIAELVRTSNTKYQDMLVEQLRLQELLKQEHEALLVKTRTEVTAEVTSRMQQESDVQMGQLRAKLKGEKEVDLMALRRELEEKLQQQREDLMAKLERALGEIKDWREKEGVLKNEKSALEETIQQLQAQIAELTRSMGDQLGGSQARLQQLSADLSAENKKNFTMQAQLREREEEIERLHNLLKEKNARLVGLETLVETRDKEVAALKAELATATAGLAAVDKTLQDKLRASETLVVSLRDELDSLRKTLTTTEARLAEIDRAMARMAAEHERVLTQLQGDKEALQSQLREKDARMGSSNDKAAAELAALNSRIQDQAAQFAKEMKDLENKYEKMLESMRDAAAKQVADHLAAMRVAQEDFARKEAQWADDAATLKKLHDRNILDLKDSHTRITCEMATNHAAEIETLKTQLAQLELQLSTATEAGAERENAIKSELSKMESKAKAIKAELEAKKKENERAESVQTGLKNQIEALREELKASQKAYRDKMDMGLAKLEADWQSKLDALKEVHEFVLKEAEAVAEVSKKRDMDEQARLHAEEMQILKNALSAEAARAAGEQGDAERVRLQLEADLREEKLGRKQDIAAAKRVHEDQLQALTVRHAQEVEDLRRSLSSSATSQISALIEQHNAALAAAEEQLSKLRIEHIEALDQALNAAARSNEDSTRRMLADLEARLTAQHGEQLRKTIDEHKAALNVVQNDHDERVIHMTTERDMMEQTLSQTLSALSTSEKALSEEKSEAQRKAFNYAAEKEQMLRDAELALRQEKEGSLRSLKDQQDGHAADMRLLKEEFAEDRARFDERLGEMMKELEAMERRYQNRESRADDLARIAALEQELIDKDELVAKTREEMMYFKREMLNREESYNVKFNAKPTVGVMQVLKTKEEPTAPGVKSSKPTRIVGAQPGMGMGGMPGLGGMGIGNSAIPPGIPGSSKSNMPPLPRSK